ncbi:MAG: hypothetical protein JEZ03_00405 [Bacteroidales bacterium]|nr:hypothetical protein [Bacteroidales bacterium]
MKTIKQNPISRFRFFTLAMVTLVLSSCSFAPYNRIISDKDPYKQETSIKMKQLVRAYSNEHKYHFHYLPHHTVKTSYSNFHPFGERDETYMEVSITTGISDREFNPRLYLNLDDQIFELESLDYVYKEFNRSSTSSSSTVTTDKETKKDKETGKEKEVLSTSTTFSTSTNNNAYQLMRHRFLIPKEIAKHLSEANHITYRIYLGDEGIDIEPDRKDRRKIRKFFRIIQSPKEKK